MGMQYRGLVPDREADTLGIGLAYGKASDEGNFSGNYENVVEMYYNIAVVPWLDITPDIQWVSNPGGAEEGGDAIVCGLRAQLSF